MKQTQASDVIKASLMFSFPPVWITALHLALLPLGANLPAPDDQQPCHLQASAQQSHLPRGQPDLLPVPGEEQKTINHNKVPGL